MKTNTLHCASFFCTYGVIALVIIGVMNTAFAQNNVPSTNQSVLNGLYSPTASERFFDEGTRRIEREIHILVNPEHYKREDILQNKTINIKTIEEIGETIEETGETKPILNSPKDSLQKELD